MAIIDLDLGLDDIVKMVISLAKTAIEGGASKKDLEVRIADFRTKMKEDTAEAKAGDLVAMGLPPTTDEDKE